MKPSNENTSQTLKIALVGTPNVGKSVVFNALTGSHAAVSNYPGTTVEVSRGRLRLGGKDLHVVDTPGMYSLLPVTEEERVARRLLLSDPPDLVLHVADAKDLARGLPLTLQLMEAGFKVLLVANMEDEAREMGLAIDGARLEDLLGVPVVLTSAVRDGGLDVLRRRLREWVGGMTQTWKQR
jgi:ferrous iron transport protein B